MDLDNPKTTIERSAIIKRKFFLKYVYLDFYNTFKKLSKDVPKGKRVEIGSGGGFIKEKIPGCITSDVMQLPGCDMCFPAEKMPFKNNSLSATYMLNTFHHIKDPQKALSEFLRCLKRGGKVVMIEPFNSNWGRFIYKNFHHEPFDTNANWKIQKKGDLSSANGALPWIVFYRDKKRFQKLFPRLKIIFFNPHTPLRYLLSGGFTLPQLLPNLFYPLVSKLETLIAPANNHIGMFVTIVLKKS